MKELIKDVVYDIILFIILCATLISLYSFLFLNNS
jgi:hypothetical protein